MTGLWGLGVVLWLGEEGSVLYVVLLGAAGAVLVVLHAVRRWLGGRILTWPRGLALGLLGGELAGAGASLATAALMSIKAPLSGHSLPDYSPAIVQATLARLPIWAVAGGLIGVGIGLLALAFSTGQDVQSGTDPGSTDPETTRGDRAVVEERPPRL